jgi:hypothetical protein
MMVRKRGKGEPKRTSMVEKMTLADARKNIDEFIHIKPVQGSGGGAVIPARKSPGKRKR